MTAAVLSPLERRGAVARARSWRDPLVFSYGWPLAVMCTLMPLWFFLGLAPFVWPVPGFLVAFVLIARPESFRMPQGAGLLVMSVIWIGFSVVQVQQSQELLLFGYRYSIFVGACFLYLWVVGSSERDLPIEAVSQWLSILAINIVGLGSLALVFGGATMESPLQRLMPDSVANSAFIDGVTRIRFAEVQNFFGFRVPRPSAPMPFTNGWGSTVGLLAPYFVFSWLRSPFPSRRRLGFVLAGLSLIPIVFSMNRGLVLSLVVALLVVSVQRGVGGNWMMLRNVLVSMAAIALIVALTPLSALVTSKLEGSANSNEDRSSIYVDAVKGSVESPIVGHGTPGDRGDAPPVGSHGLLWWIMYCHGFVALGLFFGWAGKAIWDGRLIRRESETWALVALVIFVVQIPIYGLLPQLPIGAVSAALVQRAAMSRRLGTGQ